MFKATQSQKDSQTYYSESSRQFETEDYTIQSDLWSHYQCEVKTDYPFKMTMSIACDDQKMFRSQMLKKSRRINQKSQQYKENTPKYVSIQQKISSHVLKAFQSQKQKKITPQLQQLINDSQIKRNYQSTKKGDKPQNIRKQPKIQTQICQQFQNLFPQISQSSIDKQCIQQGYDLLNSSFRPYRGHQFLSDKQFCNKFQRINEISNEHKSFDVNCNWKPQISNKRQVFTSNKRKVNKHILAKINYMYAKHGKP